ncbi:hypothetical protein GRI43_05120 [Altererythrobacter luteolus]|uniref:Uncharacterized protein n=1 Tax=Pontixanthobacter luteolus TaxID=295089 RepID=A0A6I4V301_9SPHN|nr:hypothetical protein [Pontixanthobacter luteolus]MXP46774.1 hypothetical protein [Pontixanthobacter luteolus]
MSEERITRTETIDGNTHTETTIVRDREPSGGGSKTWVLLAILAIVAVIAFVVFAQVSDAEIARDNAIAGAANDVGEAAQKAGDAAEDVARDLTGND